MNLSHTELAPMKSDEAFAPPSGEPALAVQPARIQLFPPRQIEWTQVRLDVTALPASLRGLRIVHLTDFHLRRRWPIALEPVLRRIAQAPPDLILITGDFVDNKRNYRPALPHVRRMLRSLRSRFGCFGIHGNHDNYEMGPLLGDEEITFLDGRRQVVEIAGAEIELIGLPGKHRDDLDVSWLHALPARTSGRPRIVLSHFPDHLRRTTKLDADLFLAGHTHGGQICLPSGTPLIWHDGLPRALCKGVNRVGKTWLVVGRGLGYTTVPLRAFCTPEVIEIVLDA